MEKFLVISRHQIRGSSDTDGSFIYSISQIFGHTFSVNAFFFTFYFFYLVD